MDVEILCQIKKKLHVVIKGIFIMVQTANCHHKIISFTEKETSHFSKIEISNECIISILKFILRMSGSLFHIKRNLIFIVPKLFYHVSYRKVKQNMYFQQSSDLFHLLYKIKYSPLSSWFLTSIYGLINKSSSFTVWKLFFLLRRYWIAASLSRNVFPKTPHHMIIIPQRWS